MVIYAVRGRSTSIVRIFSGPHLLRPKAVNWRSYSYFSKHNFYFAARLIYLSHNSSVHSYTPSLGHIQSCCRPVGWDRLALPVPERLLRPAGPWQRLPHGLRRRTCAHWNVDVLLLRHSACSGMGPLGDQWSWASLVLQQMIFSALHSCELLLELVFFAAFTLVPVTMDPRYWLCRVLYWEVTPHNWSSLSLLKQWDAPRGSGHFRRRVCTMNFAVAACILKYTF